MTSVEQTSMAFEGAREVRRISRKLVVASVHRQTTYDHVGVEEDVGDAPGESAMLLQNSEEPRLAFLYHQDTIGVLLHTWR